MAVPIDRQVVALPEVRIHPVTEEIKAISASKGVTPQTLCDMLSQASGWPRSPYFCEAGSYVVHDW
jgi:hypothetical protein